MQNKMVKKDYLIHGQKVLIYSMCHSVNLKFGKFVHGQFNWLGRPQKRDGVGCHERVLKRELEAHLVLLGPVKCPLWCTTFKYR